MSADNPAKPGTGADKPAPAAPDGGAHGDSAHGGGAHGDGPPKAETRSPAQFARDVHRTRPRDDDPPAAAPRPGGRDTAAPGPPRDDGPGCGGRRTGQDQGGGEQHGSTQAGPRDGHGRAPQAAAGQDGPAGGAPGTRAVPGQDHGRRPVPAPETTQPGDQGTRRGNAPDDGGGHQPAEPRSPAQFARDVRRSRPRDDDPPAAASRDSTRGTSPGPRAAAGTESAPRQRPARETAQQATTPARERPASEASARETGGGRELAAARSPEADPGRAGTAEHGPRTQDPEPAPHGENGTVGRPAEAGHPVLHITSEFHGQKLDMYTDGVHWKSGEAVRAMAAQDGKDGQPKEPAGRGISDAPTQRDLGDNTRGENPDVHLGDTTDQRTFAEKMTGEGFLGKALREKDDPSEKGLGDLIDEAVEGGDDLHDGSGGAGEAISDILARGPAPTGSHTLHSGHPGYDVQPSHGLNMNDAVGGTVLVIVAAAAAGKHMIESRRRDH